MYETNEFLNDEQGKHLNMDKYWRLNGFCDLVCLYVSLRGKGRACVGVINQMVCWFICSETLGFVTPAVVIDIKRELQNISYGIPKVFLGVIGIFLWSTLLTEAIFLKT